LRAFRRVALGAGESRRVEFTLGRDGLSFLDAAMKPAVEPAELSVWIAPHAQAGTPAKVTLR
ncbi:MAG TPA: fibronectin type III-like domain-contianing protein, partial [Pyrinomonadaceae bacterium]